MGWKASPEPSNSPFPTTDWRLVRRARISPADRARLPLSMLMQAYVPALRRYLLRVKRLAPSQTDEAVQDFITRKILDGKLLEHADRRRGRFRNLLVQSLENYLVDRARHERARQPASGPAIPIDESTSLQTNALQPLQLFEREWAKSVLTDALARMHEHCEKRKRLDLWEIFHCRIVAPAADNLAPISYKVLVERFGLETPVQAANALLSARRIFAKKLRQVLVEQAGPDADPEQELNDLRKILSQPKQNN